MVDVAKNLKEVLGHLPEGVELVAISKYHPNEYILLRPTMRDNASSARAMSRSCARRWRRCQRTSNGTSSATCRRTR